MFCLLSGVVYIVNDISDRDSDRRHPLKARRPIASGALPVKTAAAAAVAIGAVALAGASALGLPFLAVAVAYLVLQSLYSGPLKHIVIIDVLTLAIGFVLRAVAGAVAVNVEISHWLLVCTILLALFIALAKRRHEIVLLADGAASHRPILGEYSAYLLDQMIAVVTASTLDRVRLLHDQPRDAGEVRYPLARAHDSVPVVRDFSVPVSRAQARRRRQPRRPAPDRPPAARLRGGVGARRRPDHLPAS